MRPFSHDSFASKKPSPSKEHIAVAIHGSVKRWLFNAYQALSPTWWRISSFVDLPKKDGRGNFPVSQASAQAQWVERDPQLYCLLITATVPEAINVLPGGGTENPGNVVQLLKARQLKPRIILKKMNAIGGSGHEHLYGQTARVRGAQSDETGGQRAEVVLFAGEMVGVYEQVTLPATTPVERPREDGANIGLRVLFLSPRTGKYNDRVHQLIAHWHGDRRVESIGAAEEQEFLQALLMQAHDKETLIDEKPLPFVAYFPWVIASALGMMNRFLSSNVDSMDAQPVNANLSIAQRLEAYLNSAEPGAAEHKEILGSSDSSAYINMVQELERLEARINNFPARRNIPAPSPAISARALSDITETDSKPPSPTSMPKVPDSPTKEGESSSDALPVRALSKAPDSATKEGEPSSDALPVRTFSKAGGLFGFPTQAGLVGMTVASLLPPAEPESVFSDAESAVTLPKPETSGSDKDISITQPNPWDVLNNMVIRAYTDYVQDRHTPSIFYKQSPKRPCALNALKLLVMHLDHQKFNKVINTAEQDALVVGLLLFISRSIRQESRVYHGSKLLALVEKFLKEQLARPFKSELEKNSLVEKAVAYIEQNANDIFQAKAVYGSQELIDVQATQASQRWFEDCKEAVLEKPALSTCGERWSACYK